MKNVFLIFLFFVLVSCKTVSNFQIIESAKENPRCKVGIFSVDDSDFFIQRGTSVLSGCFEKLEKTKARVSFLFFRSKTSLRANINLTTGESNTSRSYSREDASGKLDIRLNTKATLEIPSADKKGSFMFSFLYKLKNNQPSIEIYDVTEDQTYIPRLAFQAVGKNDLPRIQELFSNGSIDKETSIILFDTNTTYEVNLFQNAMNTHSKLEVIKYLIKQKIDFRFKDTIGFTALTYAAFHNDLELLEYIYSLKKWELNEKTNQGDTVLHWAAANKNQAMIKFLLKKGSNKDIKNNLGLTASDIAKTNNNSDLMESFE
ncbi:ankyrin repeat domain-containing protein [Leptospira sp. 96542]|nr:ankyrin repeat domain-containing protein [Leptospira sp. 96542]